MPTWRVTLISGKNRGKTFRIGPVYNGNVGRGHEGTKKEKMKARMRGTRDTVRAHTRIHEHTFQRIYITARALVNGREGRKIICMRESVIDRADARRPVNKLR